MTGSSFSCPPGYGPRVRPPPPPSTGFQGFFSSGKSLHALKTGCGAQGWMKQSRRKLSTQVMLWDDLSGGVTTS